MSIFPGGAASGASSNDEMHRFVRGVTAIIWPRHPDLGAEAPAQLAARAILGMLTLDLSNQRAPRPSPERIDVNLTILAGRIEIVVPSGWGVRAGRMNASRGVKFRGLLGQPEPGVGESATQTCCIVVHVLGIGGVVSISRVR